MTDTTQHPVPPAVPNPQHEQAIPLHLPAPPAQPHQQREPSGASVSPKSFVLTWIFAWLLGGLGVDRFYLGKVGTGILKLVTFGGFGIWVLVDLILVLTGHQRDKHGRALAGFEAHKKIAWIVTGAVIVLSIVIGSVSGASAGAGKPSAVAPISDEADAEPPAAVEEVPADEAVVEEKPAAEKPAEKPVETDAMKAQAWADKTFGTFAPLTQTGTGDNLVTLPTGATAGIVTANHDGASNFSISVLNAANESTGDLLVNTIGTHSGSSVYGFNAYSDGVTLQITADGNWSVSIAPVSTAPALATAGTGDAVFLHTGSAGKLTATHDGGSNFVVQEETGKAFSMGLLVNEIGTYSGTVPLSSGPSVITVGADGNWTMLAE